MSGSSGINLPSLLCSCVGQAAILGGIIYGLSEAPREKLGRKESAPLVIELLPLDRDDAARGDATGEKRTDVHPTLVPHDGKRSAEPVKPVAGALANADMAKLSEPKLEVSREASGDNSAASASEFSVYQRRLYEALARSSRYPVEARRMRLSGVTRLAFRVDRVGHVLESWIQESSGSELLDEAALEALGRAAPLPPIPVGLPSRLDFVIEIDLSTMQQFASRAAG